MKLGYFFLLIKILAMITNPIIIAVPAPARKAPMMMAPMVFVMTTAAIVTMAMVVAVAMTFRRARFSTWLFLGFVILCQRNHTAQAAQVHGIDGAARHDDQGTLFLKPFKEHIHGAQVQGGGIVDIRFGCF